MAKFTTTTSLNIRFAGNDLVGNAGDTYRIPDALADEFAAAYQNLIPGFSWVAQDETTTYQTIPVAQADVTDLVTDLAAKADQATTTAALALKADDATMQLALAGKMSTTGATATGPLVVTDVTGSGAFAAPTIGGVIYADQYSTLAAALTAGAGGIVHIPAGTYALSSSLMPASNTRVTGVGEGTVLTMSADTPVIQCAASASGVIVEKLKIVGSATSASTSSFGVYAPSGCDDITFSDIHITDCWRSVAVTTASNVRVKNVTIVTDRSTVGGAIDIHNSTYVRVLDCLVASPTGHGIDFREGGGYNSAIGCSVYSSGSGGFVISGSSGTGKSIVGIELIGCKSIVAGVTNTAGCGFIMENGAKYCRISDSYSVSAALDGYLVGQGTGDVPTNNVISGSIASVAGLHGIYVFHAYHTTITGCRVANTTSGDGIRINNNHQVLGSATVTGCVVTDMQSTTSAAINVTGTAEGVAVSGCAVRSVNGYGIYIDAPRTIVSGCSVMDADASGTLTIGGITISATGDRSIVNGCTSHRSSGTKQDYGIDIQSGCTNAIITSNVIVTNTTTTYLDNGTGTTLANNVLA